jgi:hypothetical protein
MCRQEPQPAFKELIALSEEPILLTKEEILGELRNKLI